MTSATALVRLEIHPFGGVCVLDRCPLCDQVHRHGGGGASQDARNFLGRRDAQCRPEDLPPGVDTSAGYVLQEAPAPSRFTTTDPQQVVSGANSGAPKCADSRADSPTSCRDEERVCVQTRPDATTEPGPERGTHERTDGRAGRSEARQRGDRVMGRTMLKAGIETLKGLTYSDLGWIWLKATGGKPPVGTKKLTLLESVQDLFTEKAKTESEPEVLSADCEAWLNEVGNGKPAPRKAEVVAAATEAAAESKRVTLEQAIQTLNSLPTKRMAAVHEQVVGKTAKGLKKPALFKGIAAALEKRAEGKGSSATLPDEAVGWLTAVKDGKQGSGAAAKKEPKDRDPRLPAPGTTITKLWRDRKLEVLVNENDLTYEGKTYRSLSRIASELLGCPANGFLFFGLTEGAKAAAAKREEKAAEKLAAAEATAKVRERSAEKPVKKTTKKEKPSKKATKA
jgi:hypothetical protein